MFVLTKEARYFWPVTIESPKDGGGRIRESLDIQFRRIQQSRIKEIIEGATDEKVTDASLVKEIVIGWKGMKDEAGAELPFSETTLHELVEIPGVGRAIVLAFFESIAGAKQKN
jgi:hypothetical protein